ncbi:uncharacterized protein N7479_003300 [Penicillium vulpinum]|uniref:Fido domain-containing protein n=1 Tax=Penicillium vulpinum TaxID=29845 RepID=A0A1V6S3D3_9EURO|nr:uncharacterized protein N7479_003300 [Penicillium vulpinum]KAJ5963424.1 hypothetical protein N7479_003300 [Penicillium vulpinum]OQE08555.1 hypothetical protein PENVUL_c009G06019 [Penicillium vulpinum]
MTTQMPQFLTMLQIQRLHHRFAVPCAPLTQPSILESAVNAPVDKNHYENDRDVFRLAAILAERIMKNHAFQDGNKRTALLAADMFLKANGYYLKEIQFAEDSHVQGLAEAHVAVVTKKWTAEQLCDYYRSVALPLA